MRFTGVTTSKAMEAGLGAIWGEDPRYVPARDKPFRGRIGHIFVMTVMATRRDGQLRPRHYDDPDGAGNADSPSAS